MDQTKMLSASGDTRNVKYTAALTKKLDMLQDASNEFARENSGKSKLTFIDEGISILGQLRDIQNDLNRTYHDLH
jgi:hypothetical protein